MYKIMYRVNETMRRHMSAVVYSEEAGKMVEAHFPTQEEATAAAREWFVNAFSYYNCCPELGTRPAFYVAE